MLRITRCANKCGSSFGSPDACCGGSPADLRNTMQWIGSQLIVVIIGAAWVRNSNNPFLFNLQTLFRTLVLRYIVV